MPIHFDRTSDMAVPASPEGAAHSLIDWGWDERRSDEFAAFAGLGLWPARVIAQHRGSWVVVGATGETNASPTGRLRHDAEDGGLPAVGDWVGCLPAPHDGEARMDAILSRRSAFRRRAAGTRPGAQIISANVDCLFVATSLNADLNPRRLERYVAMAGESGAEPVVVLTKADLIEESDSMAARFEAELRVPVVAVSARTGLGIESVTRWFERGKTVALVGSSGVGKSTLLNHLAGEELMPTREVREDDARGRHTTTHRELFLLSNGALVLDTPGMREFGLWEADEGVDETFGEIVELAARCRFADCSHRFEPGCAVQAAVSSGRLDAGRLKSYRRLAHELAEQPTPAQRRERDRPFHKAIRNGAADSMARKRYDDRP
jgi:ribosome biogenesis GTPase